MELPWDPSSAAVRGGGARQGTARHPSSCSTARCSISQIVKVEVKADPKSFDLLDLHGPVIVEGKIHSPSTRIGRVIPIPTPVIGNAKNVACEAATRQLFSAQP
jgi:hypothetical protein